MKVKFNEITYYKGKHYNEGDSINVDSRIGGAWIQTGKANEVSSKKTVRSSKRKQADSDGGEINIPRDDSKKDD
jgi:hypothetical protein